LDEMDVPKILSKFVDPELLRKERREIAK